jgi:HAD superfamily hydrolase (TIGR01509 family)
MHPVSTVLALLFDLDGVLVDTEPVWESVRREFVGRHGAAWSQEIQARMMGVRTDVWSAALSELLGGAPPPSQVAPVVIEEIAARYRLKLPVIRGADGVVRNLARHYPMGIASGSPRVLIDLVLELAGLTDCFACALSSDDVEHGKPAPDPYLELAMRLGFKPEDCAAIEDSGNGLRSAMAAGTRVIAIPRGENIPDSALLAQADAVLSDITELTPELLGALR